MTDWMEMTARIAALEAKAQEQQQQIDAMKDRTTVCDCCGGYNGEHYPNCPAWARTAGDKPEQEGWDYDCDALWFNGVNHIDAGTHALNAAGITPDTSDDELAAMARLGKLRERAKKLTEQYTTHDLARQCQALLRELLLGERP